MGKYNEQRILISSEEYSSKHLTDSERKKIMMKMSFEQRDVIKSIIRINRKSKFANILANHRGEGSWRFADYIDHEFVRKDVTCLCGKPLRHEFILKNDSGDRRSIGVHHLAEEMGIPLKVANEVKKGLHQIK